MLPSAKTLIGYLPLAIFAAVMLWRLRTMDKARPLRLRTIWILPVLFVIVVGFVLTSMPPGPWGTAAFILGMLIGVGVGWQRARWMRLHIEGEGDAARIMVRQSPAALLLVMAIAGLRIVFKSATGSGSQLGSTSAHLSTAALMLTDALLGFALGMIVALRVELWRRAKDLSASKPAP